MHDPIRPFEGAIAHAIQQALSALFGIQGDIPTLQQTRKEFLGTFTWVAFGAAKTAGKSPDELAQSIGKELVNNSLLIKDFNVVKGFLNLELSQQAWEECWTGIQGDLGTEPLREDEPAAMVEYSSPNTNKPLHLGHVRNNLLGNSVSEMIRAT